MISQAVGNSYTSLYEHFKFTLWPNDIKSTDLNNIKKIDKRLSFL